MTTNSVKIGLWAILCFTLSAYGYESAKQIPRPDLWVKVTDPKDVISEADEQKLNTMLEDHRQASGHQISVVVVDKIEGMTPKDFAVELFEAWKIGEIKKDNGLLILLSRDDRRVEFEVGYGLEGDLTDYVSKKIQMDHMVPAFKNGNYGEGLVAGVAKVIEVLNGATLPVHSTEEKPDNNIYVVVGFFVFIFGVLFAFVYFHLRGRKKTKSLTSSQQIKKNQSLLLGIGGLSIFAMLIALANIEDQTFRILIAEYFFLAGIAMAFIYSGRRGLRDLESLQERYNLIVKNHFPKWLTFMFPAPIFFLHRLDQRILAGYRRHPQQCAHCGKPMRLLTDVEEMKHLSRGQVVEQEIQSVDHDVWFCEDDKYIKLFHAGYLDSKYTPCTKCSAVALKLIGKETIKAATTSSSGHGVETYNCVACGSKVKVEFTIPKVSTSSSSSGGFSSSSSGSSYSGGGRSGGGGAGSSW